MSEESTRTVYYERKLGDPISEETRRELEALAAMPDEMIDFSDIPEQKPEDWKNAKRFHEVYKSKQTTTLQLDRDVLTWLETIGPESSAVANRILRERMIAERGASGQAEREIA